MIRLNLDDFPAVVKQVERNTVDIEGLLKHRDDCGRMHLQHLEHDKKHDDSMDKLTQSNIVLAASISEMNLILSKFTKMVEDGQPVINFWNRVGIDTAKHYLYSVSSRCRHWRFLP